MGALRDQGTIYANNRESTFLRLLCGKGFVVGFLFACLTHLRAAMQLSLPLAATAVFLVGALPFNSNAADIRIKGDSKIEVVYITAADCIYCKSWRYMRTGDWGRFSETETGRAVTLITADKVTLRNTMRKDFYPPEHASLFDNAPKFGNIVPAWWIVVDGVPVLRRVGENRWKTEVEPALETLVLAKKKNGGVVPAFTVLPPKASMIPTDVNDVDNLPYMSDRAKESYRRFLTQPTPRAFALSRDGSYGWWRGGSNPRLKAEEQCNATAMEVACQIYAVDNAVVWRDE